MIYIGQYNGKLIRHEEPFVAKTCNQTCNKLQDTDAYCPNCGSRMDLDGDTE